MSTISFIPNCSRFKSDPFGRVRSPSIISRPNFETIGPMSLVLDSHVNQPPPTFAFIETALPMDFVLWLGDIAGRQLRCIDHSSTHMIHFWADSDSCPN